MGACRERGKVQLTGQAWYKGAAFASPVSVKHHGVCIAGIPQQLHIHQDRHAQHARKETPCPGTCKISPAKLYHDRLRLSSFRVQSVDSL